MIMKSPNVLWVRERFPWMGEYSGCDQLCVFMPKVQPAVHRSVWRTEKPLPAGTKTILPWVVDKTRPNPFYTATSLKAELQSLWKARRHKTDLVHVIYLENTLDLLARFKKFYGSKLIATAHQPPRWWEQNFTKKEVLRSLDHLIVFSHEQYEYFQTHIPGRVSLILNGVDVNFFQPKTIQKKDPRCVFSGIYLRDTLTLTKTIQEIIFHRPDVQFDMVTPLDPTSSPNLKPLLKHPQVHWYRGVSNENLRSICQDGSVFLFPLKDATANTALLEAMACGLPVVSNDIGGVKDYVQKDFADLHEVGDFKAMSQSVLDMLSNPPKCQKRGELARRHVAKNLSWESVSEKTMQLYQQVLSN